MHAQPRFGAIYFRHWRKLVFPVCALLVVLFGVALRWQVQSTTIVDTPVRADARDYVVSALNIKLYGTVSSSDSGLQAAGLPPQPDAFRPPFYSFYLASLLDLPLSEAFEQQVRWQQTVLGIVTVIAAMWLAWFLSGRIVALVAGSLVALSPHIVMMEVYLLTETLFTVLVMASVAVIVLAASTPRTRTRILTAILGGLLLGLSALTRSTTVFFPLFLVLLAIAWPGHWRQAIVIVIGVFVVVYAPWTIRNAGLPDDSAGSELTKSFLQHGMYPGMMYEGRPESLGIAYHFDPSSEKIRESTSTVLNEIGRRFKEDPQHYMSWYLFGKPISLWSWNIIAGQGDVFVYPVIASAYLEPETVARHTRSIMKLLHWPLVLLAVAGSVFWMFIAIRCREPVDRDKGAIVVALVLVYVTTLHVIGAPYPRYSIPFRPELYILATVFVARLVNFLRRRVECKADSQQAAATNGYNALANQE